MFKREPPRTTATVRIPLRLHASVERISATIEGSHPGDILEFGFEVVQELLARIEAAGRAPDLMSGNSLELARLLVDHFALVVAERVGAATMPPEPHDEDGDPVVSDSDTRMFQ